MEPVPAAAVKNISDAAVHSSSLPVKGMTWRYLEFIPATGAIEWGAGNYLVCVVLPGYSLVKTVRAIFTALHSRLSKSFCVMAINEKDF